MPTISPVKPYAGRRHYSNPHCQGTLIKQTKNWPKLTKKGESVNSAYIDRMASWDREKFERFVVKLQGKKGQDCGLDQLAEKATDKTLVESAKEYFGDDITAVRWVYYFNRATGYPCERIDYIYREAASDDTGE